MLIRNRQLLAALGTTGSQHAAAILRGHPLTETMLVCSPAIVGLECSFHLFCYLSVIISHFGLQRYLFLFIPPKFCANFRFKAIVFLVLSIGFWSFCGWERWFLAVGSGGFWRWGAVVFLQRTFLGRVSLAMLLCETPQCDVSTVNVKSRDVTLWRLLICAEHSYCYSA